MTVTAPSMSEQQFQEQIVQLAELFGWLVYHTFDSRHSAPGFPDLVLVRGDVLIFAELKTEKGRIRPEQQTWLEALDKVAMPLINASNATGAQRRVFVELWRPSMFEQIKLILGHVR